MKALLLSLLIPSLHAGTFATWADDEFDSAEMNDRAVSGPNADPDKDGMSNLLEYALGTDPLFADAADGRVNLALENGQVQIEFKNDSSKTDVTLVVQKSSDLKTWTEMPSEVLSVKKGLEKRRVTVPAKSRAFFRFQASR